MKGRVTSGMLAGAVVALLAMGGAAAWWGLRTLLTSEPPSVSDILENPNAAEPGTTDNSTPAPDATQPRAQVYWLEPTETSFELVAIAPEGTATDSNPDAQLTQAFKQLLAGTEGEAYASTIPDGTRLQELSVREDGVYLSLSEEFNFGGGSASMQGRLGQVLYTATSLDPQAPVYLRVNGEPLKYLGGEGIPVPQPLTRAYFEDNFSL